MQKTYWWRVFILFFSIIIFGWGYIVTSRNDLDRFYNSYTDPSMFLSLSVFIISIISFFIVDTVFIKWFRFFIVWFFLAIIFITFAPEYYGGWLGLGPTKEFIAIWMSALFVILSITKITWDSWKIRKN